MKYTIALLLAVCYIFPSFGQTDTIVPVEEPEKIETLKTVETAEAVKTKKVQTDTVNVANRVKVAESGDKTTVTLGQNEVLIVEENGDTTRVRLGNKGISIVEGDEGTSINIIEMEDLPKKSSSNTSSYKKKKFKPYYAGLDIGLNNFLTPNNDFNYPPEDQFMDLNTGRSWNFSINFIDYGIGFGTDKVGLVTGMGFEFSWYSFNNQSNIQKDDNGIIVEYLPTNADNMTHSRIFTSYLTVPLLLEFQIPAGKNRIHLSAGAIGGVKLWSSRRMKYQTPGSKSKTRTYGDYNLTPFRYGATARIGYGMVNLYANYYISTLFKSGKGPEMHPIAAGLSFTW